MEKETLEYLEYNSKRSPIVIHEYGRHIQNMVRQVIDIEDVEKRNQMAKAIIGIMGNLNPHLRDVPDFQHKLWDQLFIISDFKLEVDSPYPKISKEILEERPEPLSYPKATRKHRYYGKNVLKLIESACQWEDKDTYELLLTCIGNHMKKSYLNWNKDTVEDEVIFNHMKELSKGKLLFDSEKITLVESSKLLKMGLRKQSNYSYKSKNRKSKKRNNG